MYIFRLLEFFLTLIVISPNVLHVLLVFQLNVALGFAENGIVLAFGRFETEVPCFDAERFSCHSHEKEVLFFGGDSRLQIRTIYKIEGGSWSSFYREIEAIRTIRSIANGSDFPLGLSTKIQSAVLEMLGSVLRNDVESVIKSEYIRDLLKYQIVNTSSHVHLDWSSFYGFLQSLFMKNERIPNMYNICNLFPNTKHITILVPSDFTVDMSFIDSMCDDFSSITKTMKIEFQWESDTESAIGDTRNLIERDVFRSVNVDISLRESCICFVTGQRFSEIDDDSINKPQTVEIQDSQIPLEVVPSDTIESRFKMNVNEQNLIVDCRATDVQQLAERFVRYGKWGCPINVYYVAVLLITIINIITDVIALLNQSQSTNNYFWSSLSILGLSLCVCLYFGVQCVRQRDQHIILRVCAALVIFESLPQCLLQIWALWRLPSTPIIWISLCVSLVSILLNSTLFVPVAVYFADARSAIFLWTAANVDGLNFVLLFAWYLQLSLATQLGSKFLYFYLFSIIAGLVCLFSVSHLFFFLRSRNHPFSRFTEEYSRLPRWQRMFHRCHRISVFFLSLLCLLLQLVFCSVSAFIVARAGHIQFVTEQNWLAFKLYFKSLRQSSIGESEPVMFTCDDNVSTNEELNYYDPNRREMSVAIQEDLSVSIQEALSVSVSTDGEPSFDIGKRYDISSPLTKFAKSIHLKSAGDVCRMWFALQINRFYRLEGMASLIRISFPIGFYLYITLSLGWTNVHLFMHILNALYIVLSVMFMTTAPRVIHLTNSVISENRRTLTLPDLRVRNESVVRDELDSIIREMLLLLSLPEDVVRVITEFAGKMTKHQNYIWNRGYELLPAVLQNERSLAWFADHLKREYVLS